MRNTVAIALACGTFVACLAISQVLRTIGGVSIGFIAPVANRAGVPITLTATYQDLGGRVAHSSRTVAPAAEAHCGVYAGENTAYARTQTVVLAAFKEKSGCFAVERFDCSKWSERTRIEVTDDAIIVHE
jgi:hypothetical protein